MLGHRESELSQTGHGQEILEGIASVLWSTGLGARGELLCVQERAQSHWLPQPAFGRGEQSCWWLPWAPRGVQGGPSSEFSPCPLMGPSELERTSLVIPRTISCSFSCWNAIWNSVVGSTRSQCPKPFLSCQCEVLSQLLWDRCRAGVAGGASQWHWVYFRVGESHCTWSHIPLRFGMPAEGYDALSWRWVWKVFVYLRKASWVPVWQENKISKFNIVSGVNGRAAPPSAQLYCKLVLWWTWQHISKVTVKQCTWIPVNNNSSNVQPFYVLLCRQLLQWMVRPQYLTCRSRNSVDLMHGFNSAFVLLVWYFVTKLYLNLIDKYIYNKLPVERVLLFPGLIFWVVEFYLVRVEKSVLVWLLNKPEGESKGNTY